MAFIGLDRGIVDHWIYQDAEYFKVWFEMLHRARFAQEPHTELVDGEMVVVNYSEFIYGRIKWSARLKVSEQRLRTLIKKLKAEEMIEVVSEHRKCTLYRIKNYAKFNQQSNQQKDQSQQGFESRANQQSNQSSTSSQPAANQQLTTKEELNNLITNSSVVVEGDNEPKTAMDAYIFSFKKLQYTGHISNYVMKLFDRGYDDSFVREVFMQMGANGVTDPNEEYMRKLAEDWIVKGVRSRAEARTLKDSAKGGTRIAGFRPSSQRIVGEYDKLSL